ncbi:MAG: glycogen debranching enzyme family protein [Acidobacteriaceae bacterium]|nr:glycogen debranching enzyme family protein [Acidobacteriaceae bacterium]
MIRFSGFPARDLDAALGKEWLETNGIGGFASSTIVGLNTRRYHGLLTAATRPPLGRVVLLSKLEETVIRNGARTELACNEYAGAIHPTGHEFLEEFRLDPFPVFAYRVGELAIEKRVFAVYGENTTVVQYHANLACGLELRPLIAFRDYHSLTHRNDALNGEVQISPGLLGVTPYRDLPALYFAHDAGKVDATGEWYYRFRYRVEQERGLDSEEDLFQPFLIRMELAAGQTASIVVSTEQRDAKQAETMRRTEVERRHGITSNVPGESEFVQTLALAADQFIVKRGDLQTVIAGYHWFSDWGRDTMIALPGLTLATGRVENAKKILLAFAGAVSEGMLPNRWPDAGEVPEYNTVDATLWFFEAIGARMRYTHDYEFLRANLMETLHSIIDWHVRGTRFGIRVQENGLLRCGEAGSQLTWMDAKLNGVPVTPRVGMPVEIQALWYNALRTMQEFSSELGEALRAEQYGAMAEKAQTTFHTLFWNAASACLYDVVDDDSRDDSIRPNQIFAISLTHPLVEGERARHVVDCVERELLTPFGLRTLSRRDSRYVGRYEGGPNLRDGAYHQGTVWSWLWGAFVAAYLRVHENDAVARQQVRSWLRNLEGHLNEAGLGQVSEIFDGDPPHHPRGCIAQAWSVGELMRICQDEA